MRMINDAKRYEKGLADGRTGSFEPNARDISYLAGVEKSLQERGLPPPIKISAKSTGLIEDAWLADWADGRLSHEKPSMDAIDPPHVFDVRRTLYSMLAPC